MLNLPRKQMLNLPRSIIKSPAQWKYEKGFHASLPSQRPRARDMPDSTSPTQPRGPRAPILLNRNFLASRRSFSARLSPHVAKRALPIKHSKCISTKRPVA